MNTKRTVLLVLALSSASTFAHAQSPAPGTTTPAPNTSTQAPATSTPGTSNTGSMNNNAGGINTNTMGANDANNSGSGLRMADRATLAIRFVTVKPADIMSSRLVGTNVYNNQNESIGEIEDLVIDNGKTVTAVVVSVGGFLGMGESYVALDPGTMVLSQRDGAWKAFVDTSKDSLKNAPKFNYSRKRS